MARLIEQLEVIEQLQVQGFATTQPLLTPADCEVILTQLHQVANTAAGTRNLLALPWCAALAQTLASHAVIASVLPHPAVAVQCTLFEKSPQQNWLVPLHQDLSIAVAEQVEHPEIRGWSQKEGQRYAQPPAALLAEVLAVRLQLDRSSPNSSDNGSLRVVPGSHRHGRLSDAQTQALKAELGEVTCMVPQGGVMLMRPLLLHSSSKLGSLSSTPNRRVLHFLFGPNQLPFGLRWAQALPVQFDTLQSPGKQAIGC
jgi:hypothetical protein